MIETIKPGALCRFVHKNWDPSFCFVEDGLIQCRALWSQRCAIEHGDIVMFLENRNITEEDIQLGLRPTAAAAARWATAMATVTVKAMETATAVTATATARKEYKETGKISGGMFLTSNAKIIWISHLDFDFFEPVSSS